MDFPDYEFLDVRLETPLLRITINRPQAHNALNRQLIRELVDVFERLQLDTQFHLVLLAANGTNFCVGADLKELDGMPGETILSSLVEQRRIARIVALMRSCPQPVITRLQGVAAGGGMAIALASDIRIASEDFKMNAAFIKVGLGGCDIGVSYFLPRMIGASRAAKYLYTGRFIDAVEGEKLGLFSEVVKASTLDETAENYLRELSGMAPLGLRLTKEALNHAIDASSLDAVIAMEDRNQILTCANGDFAEGIQAFREGRAPSYND